MYTSCSHVYCNENSLKNATECRELPVVGRPPWSVVVSEFTSENRDTLVLHIPSHPDNFLLPGLYKAELLVGVYTCTFMHVRTRSYAYMYVLP